MRPPDRSVAALITAASLLAARAAWAEEAPAAGIFDPERKSILVAIGIFSILFFFFLAVSRKGRALTLRRLAGVAAIEEAIGRATEMGRPILFIPGINSIDDIQTLAGIGILGHVAKMAARYDATIVVPTRSSIVMSVCEETVRESYLAAGRPDAFRADNILYLSDEQFAYTVGVDGIMLRDKPAANMYLGAFYAESLILAETGFAAGAIQVAGTANTAQLPFFIAACDYTLIAEEFYAASAYLSRDPKILSSVKASDYYKIIVIAVLFAGFVLAMVNPKWLEVLKAWI